MKSFRLAKHIEAHFFDPVGERRAEQPLQVSILRLHGLDRGLGPVAGQVAEHDEMLAGLDLGLELGIGLLPAFEADGLGLLVALLRRQPGSLFFDHLLGAGRIRLDRLLGVDPVVEFRPLLDPLLDLGDRLGPTSRLLPPWGMRGSSSPLIRKTRWLSSGLPAITIAWSSVRFWLPFFSFSKVDRSSLPVRNAGPVSAVAVDAIGHEDRRDIL